MVKLIKEAGGFAVLAHPHNQLDYIDTFLSWGFEGIEVWHPDLLEESERLEALKIAQKYDLFVSGGSDHSGLCGGEYERYENPKESPFWFPEQSLGTTEGFFHEIKDGRKSPDRAELFRAAIIEQEKLVK